MKNIHAVALGRLGGARATEAQAAAGRRNAEKARAARWVSHDVSERQREACRRNLEIARRTRWAGDGKKK